MESRVSTITAAVSLWGAFEDSLDALVDRARDVLSEGGDDALEGDLLRLAARGLSFRNALRDAAAPGLEEAAGGLSADPGEVLLGVHRRAGEVAELTAARATVGVRAVLPRTAKDSLVFEQAWLVGLLSAVAATLFRDGVGASRLRWLDDLPVGRFLLAGGQSLALLTARPRPGVPGLGLAVGVVHRGKVSVTLIVPRRVGVGPNLTRVFALRLDER